MTPKNIFGAVTVGIALFFLWPAVFGSWSEVGALKDAVAERQQLAAQRKDILDKAATEYAKYQKVTTGDVGKLFTEFVPVKKDSAEFISGIQDAATQAGIQITQIQNSEQAAKTTDQFKTITTTIDLSGSYASFRTFLSNMEQYIRLFNIDGVQIVTDQGGQLRFTVRGNAYFIK